MKKRYTIFTVLVLVAVLIMSGCSSSTTDAPATSTPSTSTTTSSTTSSSTSSSSSSTSATTETQAEEETIELRFAHQNPPNGWTTVKFIDPFAEKIEEVTNGRVEVTMYPAQSLAKSTEMIEATRGGICDITWTIMGYYTGRYPLSSVMALPFLNLPEGEINGQRVSGGAVNSHIQQELYETIPEIQAEWQDVKVLWLNATSPYFVATTDTPVKNMEDLQGLKLRELGGYPSEMWKALGATPTLLGMPDVYEAAEKGVIDGANIPWAAVGTMKFYEVFKYWTDLPTTTSPQLVIMNLNTWNRLPADVQEQIMSISGISGAEFAGDSGWGDATKANVMQMMEDAGFSMERVVPDAGEYDRWVEIAGEPLWDKWVEEMESKGLPGQKVLDKALELVEKYRIK